MIRMIIFVGIIFLIIFNFGCGGKKSPDPDTEENISNKTAVTEIFTDSTEVINSAQFYQLEESVEDIQKEIDRMRTQVMEYEYQPPETDYTKQLKELIDNPPHSHKITLKNGSIIEGSIEKDKLDYLLVYTDLGKLTIRKSDIEGIEDLVLPIPDVVFIGHGQEEVFATHRLFTGKVMNQGSRRGDFVRVIYNLWGEDTQLIRSDSSFVEGTQIIYRSGIVTDTVLEPNQSAQFRVEIPLSDSIQTAYVTRDVRWELFD